MKTPFPFSAIVGQDEMKRAMLLTAIDPLHRRGAGLWRPRNGQIDRRAGPRGPSASD